MFFINVLSFYFTTKTHFNICPFCLHRQPSSFQIFADTGDMVAKVSERYEALERIIEETKTLILSEANLSKDSPVPSEVYLGLLYEYGS